MADAPWRCTQCGTVNEPNANACRSCGRWPSLFDLERSAIDQPAEVVEEQYRHDAPLPEELEELAVPVEAPGPRSAEAELDHSGIPEKPEPAPKWPGPEDPLDRPTEGWPRLASWIVPIAFLVYVVISIISNR